MGVSSLHLLELDRLAPSQAQHSPPAAVSTLCRDQLGWCAGFPTKLWFLTPTDDEYLSRLVIMAPPDPAFNFLDSQYIGSRKWVSSDGSKAMMCSNIEGHLFFSIFSLPDLVERASLSFPAAHPISSCSSWEGQAKIRWSPAGQLVAVLWDATHEADDEAHLGPLTIHDAATGRVVCSWHPWAGSSERSTYQFLCAWAPSCTAVVVAQLPRIEALGSEGCFTLLCMDGTHSSIDIPRENFLERVAFSPCGAFICWEAVSDGQSCGGIVTVKSAELSCTFSSVQSANSSLNAGRFMWFPACTARHGMALLPGTQGVTAPPTSGSGPWSCQPVGGLDFMSHHAGSFQRVVSPSGMLMIGAVHPAPSHTRPPTGYRDPQGLYVAQVWPESRCCFTRLHVPDGLWLPDRIAWRPGSASEVFAIPTMEGSIHILDGKQQKCICSWDCDELLRGLGVDMFNETKVVITDVMWSPDGSQLAIVINQSVVAVRF